MELLNKKTYLQKKNEAKANRIDKNTEADRLSISVKTTQPKTIFRQINKKV